MSTCIGVSSGRKVAYRNRSAFRVAINSIQLNPKAMIFEATIETTMNFNVSTLPHIRSRYFRQAGTKIKDAMN
jgi:hypothetical protein